MLCFASTNWAHVTYLTYLFNSRQNGLFIRYKNYSTKCATNCRRQCLHCIGNAVSIGKWFYWWIADLTRYLQCKIVQWITKCPIMRVAESSNRHGLIETLAITVNWRILMKRNSIVCHICFMNFEIIYQPQIYRIRRIKSWGTSVWL